MARPRSEEQGDRQWQNLFLDASKEPYATIFKGKGSSRLMSQFASMLKSKRASNAAAAKESGVVEPQLTGDEAILVRFCFNHILHFIGVRHTTIAAPQGLPKSRKKAKLSHPTNSNWGQASARTTSMVWFRLDVFHI